MICVCCFQAREKKAEQKAKELAKKRDSVESIPEKGMMTRKDSSVSEAGSESSNEPMSRKQSQSDSISDEKDLSIALRSEDEGASSPDV